MEKVTELLNCKIFAYHDLGIQKNVTLLKVHCDEGLFIF